jgi:putative transposase
MIYNPDKHHRPVWLPDRRSIHLKGYDYSQSGAYFVTICTQDRACLFGEIEKSEMQLNDASRMIHYWWNQLTNKYPNIELDEFVVMPNHLHGLIIVGADPRVCPETKLPAPPDKNKGEHTGSPLQGPISLSRMIQWFNTMTTNESLRNVKQNDWHPFNKRLWQRNYWEHIVCDENELNRIRKYIIENPFKWDQDNENPNNMGTN